MNGGAKPVVFAHLNLILERLDSLLCFDDETSLFDGLTLLSHGALPCLHKCGCISRGSRLLDRDCYMHVEVVGSLMTWHLIYGVYLLLINFLP